MRRKTLVTFFSMLITISMGMLIGCAFEAGEFEGSQLEALERDPHPIYNGKPRTPQDIEQATFYLCVYQCTQSEVTRIIGGVPVVVHPTQGQCVEFCEEDTVGEPEPDDGIDHPDPDCIYACIDECMPEAEPENATALSCFIDCADDC